MKKYISKPETIEAISLEELIEIGKSLGGNIVNGMPWSFQYNGLAVSHENDECYLITTWKETLKLTPRNMLVISGPLVWTCDKKAFFVVYQPFDFTDKLKGWLDKKVKRVPSIY